MVRLLKEALFKFLSKRGLMPHELSGGKHAFFYAKKTLLDDKVIFQYNGKTKRKNMVGRRRDSTWHYAISYHLLTFPMLCFSLKAHILFSDEGKDIWKSASKLHTARRGKGKTMFNREWRDLLLGFLASLTSEDGNIHIPLSKEFTMILPSTTIEFECGLGYDDPKDNARLIPLDDYADDELDEELIEGNGESK